MPKRLHEELLDLAEDLASNGRSQAELRRAVSTAYYALFHWLATCCADMLVGRDDGERSNPAWAHVYRRLEHKPALNRCKALPRAFPAAVQDFAQRFVDLQEERVLADYDPNHVVHEADPVVQVSLVQFAISRMVEVDAKDLRAFAVWVLFPGPRPGQILQRSP